jgi:ABC-type phosphate/phosphonate transport system substrate-binding protein
MSGCVALRAHLAGFRDGAQPLYRKAVGGFVNARQVIEALVAGTIDVGPLDSYYHDLLRRNDAAFAAQVRVVDATAAAPMPPLVATARLEERELGRLREALQECGSRADLARQRDVLLLAGFCVPAPDDYAVFAGILAAARRHAGVW